MSPIMQERARITERVELARQTYRVRLHLPAIAQAIQPGQFLMLRIPNRTDPLLGRPFAFYDTVLDAQGQAFALDVMYLVVGKMTGQLATLRVGDSLDVWGPLGNGFPRLDGLEHVGLVAGGIGQTPFLAYLRELLGQRGYGGREPRRQVQQVSFYYGVRTAQMAAGIEDFRQAGARIFLATDDGTLGFHGRVTQLVESREKPDHLVGCGPEPMMHALAELARQRGVPCHLSLETPMSCGVGICFSCVTKVRVGEGWDYKRVCVEGPVFDISQLCND